MARYPTFEEYHKRGAYQEGLKRCDALLSKNPRDVQLLLTRVRLQSAADQPIEPTLEALSSLQPPIQDTKTLLTIEEAVVDSQRDIHPRPATAGPAMTTFFTNAHKALKSPAQKTELLGLRFTTAIYDDRLADAQQALIQLKALQPKNRVLYFAHAAVTQMISSSGEDLQARLALSLARKAVADGFDAEEGLDCRVPGQILALQGVGEEVAALKGGFAESKQVFDVLRERRKEGGENGVASGEDVAKQGDDSSPTGKLAVEVETMKKKFELLVRDATDIASILAFGVDAIRVFGTAKETVGTGKEGRITVDACFLSVSALIRAFELSQQAQYLLLAAYSAEALLQHDSHVHEARMILVYLYMRLNLGGLAIRMFDSLNVREIQLDTVGHTLLTELSYTHPHSLPVSRRDMFEPAKRASGALAVYDRCEDKLAETEASVLNHGQTGMIFDIHELRRKLKASMARRLILLEQRRLARLMRVEAGEETAKLGPRVLPTWLEYADNRDFDATFNFGYNVERVLSGEDEGLRGGKVWLLYSLIVDSAWCLAMGFQTPVKDVDTLLHDFKNMEPDLKQLSLSDTSSTNSQLPLSYRRPADLACQVLELLTQSQQQPDAKTNDTVATISQTLSKLDVEALMKSSEDGSLCQNLKICYAYLDVLRTTVRACQAIEQRKKDNNQALQEVQERAKSAFASLQISAREKAKKGPSGGDVRAVLEKEAEVWTALKSLHVDGGESFCEAVSDAVKDGWEGFGRIHLV